MAPRTAPKSTAPELRCHALALQAASDQRQKVRHSFCSLQQQMIPHIEVVFPFMRLATSSRQFCFSCLRSCRYPGPSSGFPVPRYRTKEYLDSCSET
jgi:hypothetical protein